MGFSRKIYYLLSLLLLLFVGLSIKFLIDRNSNAQSAIRIDSFPRTTVSINGKAVGQTPYFDEKITAGDYFIKLNPAGQNGETLTPWQTKIKLMAGTLAYLSRDIAATEEQSSGQILTLEPLSSDKVAELAIVSSPDQALVFFDGLEKGKAPLVLKNLTAGDHEITVTADGFSDQIIHGKIVAGFRLNVIVKLGTLSETMATASGQLRPTSDLIASISASEITKPYVIIKDTPTGFLRIRSDPSITASEVGQVKPAEKYPLLSEITGWVKIKLPNIFGWVSDQYVEEVK